MLLLPPTREVLQSLVPIAASAPEELSTISFLMACAARAVRSRGGPGPAVLAVMFVYAGDPAAGFAAIEPFKQVATPLAEMAAPLPYPAIYEFTKEAGQAAPSATRSMFLDTLDDAAIDTILAFTAAPTSPHAMTQIRILGGAMGRVPSETAFAHRDATVLIAMIDAVRGRVEPRTSGAWTSAHDALRPGATGVYSNFLSDEGDGRVHEAYPGQTYQRLAQVKRRYDPTNVFHLNQNIRPAVES